MRLRPDERTKDAIEVYEVIVKYVADNGYPPTIKEVSKKTDISKYRVVEAMKTLEVLGKLKRTKKTARSIKLSGVKLVVDTGDAGYGFKY